MGIVVIRVKEFGRGYQVGVFIYMERDERGCSTFKTWEDLYV